MAVYNRGSYAAYMKKLYPNPQSLPKTPRANFVFGIHKANMTCYEFTLGKRYVSDATICDLIDLPINSFHDLMANEFNGVLVTNIHFTTKKDAEAALTWLNSVGVMDTLSGRCLQE